MDKEELNNELRAAALNGDLERVKDTLSKGADVNAKNNRGFTALMWATLNRHYEIVRLLIDAGADVNAKTDGGSTALTYAAENGYKEIVELLVEKSGGLEGVRKQMQDAIKKEKDPEKRLKLRIELAESYKEIVSCLGKETKVDAKTIKLPPKERGKFRIRRTV